MITAKLMARQVTFDLVITKVREIPAHSHCVREQSVRNADGALSASGARTHAAERRLGLLRPLEQIASLDSTADLNA